MQVNWIKLFGGIISFVVTFFAYRSVKGKKRLRIGDNQFFTENPNRISPTEYVNSWSLVIFSLLSGIILICWAFD